MSPAWPNMNETDLIKRVWARRSLEGWFRLLNPSFEVAPHHARVVQELEAVERGDTKRLIISMPPRHGKTELASIAFPSWYLGRNPDARCILASYGAGLAHKISRRARNAFETHSGYIFNTSLAGDSASVSDWDIAEHRGGLTAVGVDGPVTGKGGDLILVDDPVKDAAEAESEPKRESTKEWYRSVLRTRLHPNGAIVVIQTRWHEDDLAGWLLREASEPWKVLNLPMVDSNGAPLWDKWAGEVEKIRVSVGTRAWESLYQGRPTAVEGGTFKKSWFRYWDKQIHPVECEQIIQSWDLSFKGTTSSDFVVGTVWGKAKGRAEYHLLDMVRKRMDFPETVRAIVGLSAKWPQATVKLVEDKANGPAVISSLRGQLEGLIAVNPEGGKESRASAVSHLFEGGNVFIPNPRMYPWVEDYISEMCSFPFGSHDDAVDSTSQALTRFLGRGDPFLTRLPNKSRPVVHM